MQKVDQIPGKGRGVVATRTFEAGDFVVEYAGDLLDRVGLKATADKYNAEDPHAMAYMYEFTFMDQKYW